MTALARWRAGAVVLMAVGALMPLALARQARGRSERALAARDATAAAAYLTIVTPSPPRGGAGYDLARSEEHTSELQSPCNLVCRLLLEKKKKNINVSKSK